MSVFAVFVPTHAHCCPREANLGNSFSSGSSIFRSIISAIGVDGDMTQIWGMPHRASQLSETEAVGFSGIVECAQLSRRQDVNAAIGVKRGIKGAIPRIKKWLVVAKKMPRPRHRRGAGLRCRCQLVPQGS